MEGGQGLYRPMGGVEIFQGSVENPLRVLGTGDGCFKTLKEYSEIFVQGQPISYSKCVKGLFEWGVKKG
jgi:hypothetical protein